MPTTTYLWNDITDTVAMEKDGAGNTTAVYASDPVPFGRLRSMRRGGKTYTYHFDGRGNTTYLTDQTGRKTDAYTYDAFGTQRTATGNTENPYRFGGQHGYQYNPATDDYYVRARVYQPKRGRWRSKDPLQFLDSLRPYIFVRNRPVRFTDPSGFQAAGDYPDPRPFKWVPVTRYPGFTEYRKVYLDEIRQQREYERWLRETEQERRRERETAEETRRQQAAARSCRQQCLGTASSPTVPSQIERIEHVFGIPVRKTLPFPQQYLQHLRRLLQLVDSTVALFQVGRRIPIPGIREGDRCQWSQIALLKLKLNLRFKGGGPHCSLAFSIWGHFDQKYVKPYKKFITGLFPRTFPFHSCPTLERPCCGNWNCSARTKTISIPSTDLPPVGGCRFSIGPSFLFGLKNCVGKCCSPENYSVPNEWKPSPPFKPLPTPTLADDFYMFGP